MHLCIFYFYTYVFLEYTLLQHKYIDPFIMTICNLAWPELLFCYYRSSFQHSSFANNDIALTSITFVSSVSVLKILAFYSIYAWQPGVDWD